MDLLRLDPVTYLPDKLIEHQGTLVWTERFDTPGEFVMTTPLIEDMLALLPEMTFVTLRDTRVVMMVESHEIAATNGAPTLTIKGRTVDAFLENRALEGPVSNKKYKMSRILTPAETAGVLIWNAIVNTTTQDVTRQPITDNTRDILDIIPNTAVTDSTTVDATKKRRWLTGGQVYPQVQAVLKQGKLGLRIIRPPTNTTVTTFRFNDNTEEGVVRTVIGSSNRMLFDIYNGVDRRQGKPNSVVFTIQKDHLAEDTYLRSIAALKTMILIVPGKYDPRKYYRDRANDKDLAGWDRRVEWVDGGEPDLEDIPDRPDDDASAQAKQDWKDKRDKIQARNAQTTADFRDDLRDKADQELASHDRVKLLDAKVTADSPYLYNRDYTLGDKVTFLGNYGFKETMQVIEFVRTDDGKTNVGYPGLATVD